MQEIQILCGIPGSGKSTYARQLLKDDPTFRRLNKDDLRASLGYVKYDKNSFHELNEMTKSMLKTLLKLGFNVVVDNTNLNLSGITQLKNIAQDHDKPVRFVVKVFDTPLVTALERNALREGIANVPEEIVKNMHKDLMKLKTKLSFDHIDFVLPQQVVQNTSLPRAIICDLDGTLADTSWRNPYDASQCDKDPPNWAVCDVIEKFHHDHKILFVSGREDQYRPQTITFLEKNVDEPYLLLMRKTGDMRRDVDIKQEIFDEHIRGKYCVKFVMDDRNSVVNFWRKLGLTTFQVAPGDF